jgi:membrane protein implicated in regulation of membrane protease activity
MIELLIFGAICLIAGFITAGFVFLWCANNRDGDISPRRHTKY